MTAPWNLPRIVVSRTVSLTGKSFFVHVGLERTGTTFLQRNYFNKLEGVRYEGKCKPLKTYVNEAMSHFKGALETLRDVRDYRPVLISNEGLLDGSIASACRLKEVLPEATIFITLRNQYARIFSLYNRGSASGSTQTLLPYRRYLQTFKRSIINQNSYASIISIYNRLFNGRVEVFLFEDYCNNFDYLVRQMTSLMGCSEWRAREKYINFKNTSLSIFHLTLTKPYFLLLRRLRLSKKFYSFTLIINSILRSYSEDSIGRNLQLTKEIFGAYFNRENALLEDILHRKLPQAYFVD